MKKNTLLLIASTGFFFCTTTILLIKGDYAGRIKNKYFSEAITCNSAPDEVVYADLGYKWNKITCNAEFAPRDGAGAVVFKDSFFLIGGWNLIGDPNFPLICNNEVWTSGDGNKWNQIKKNSFIDSSSFDSKADWEGRHAAGFVTFKDKIWIVGGDPIQGHHHFDVWNSADGKKWELVNKESPVPWGPRVMHYTVVFQEKIWVMGGQTSPPFDGTEEMFYNDVWNSEDGITWAKVPTENPIWKPRGLIIGTAVFQNKIWIIGGGTYDTPETPCKKNYHDIWNSENGITWKLITDSPPWPKRQNHNVAIFDNKIWVMDGYNNDGINRNDVWFSENGVDWKELPKTPWKERHASSIFVKEDALWVVSGNNMESDVWKLSKTR